MEEFKKEIDFGLNNFGEQKTLDSAESLAQSILNLFLMRPGSIPSMPHIGINIKQYLYKLDDTFDVDEIKDKIYNQCPELIPYILIGEVKIFLGNHENQAVLIISVPIETSSMKKTILYGFGKDSSGNMIFNFQFDDNINI